MTSLTKAIFTIITLPLWAYAASAQAKDVPYDIPSIGKIYGIKLLDSSVRKCNNTTITTLYFTHIQMNERIIGSFFSDKDRVLRKTCINGVEYMSYFGNPSPKEAIELKRLLRLNKN